MFNSAAKIMDWSHARLAVEKARSEGKQVVFTNGCFDILHLGHVDYLEKARNLGDYLVVGLNSDASVSRIKGPSRPVVEEKSRARVMASLSFVDAVVIFDQATPQELIEFLRPDILTKGQDYLPENIVGAKFVLESGGRVETIPLVEGFSTSRIVDKINSKP